MAVADASGLRFSRPLPQAKAAQCIFEYIYFARPDSSIYGAEVYPIRKEFGRVLAREHPVPADIVVPVPDSANLMAAGYSEESGIALEPLGMVRNHYVGRTFIEPDQRIRDFGAKVKFNPARGAVAGKRLVVVDDSIVRGTNSRKIVKMFRQAGAKEIHMRISSPPIIDPCHYGIDTPDKEQLIAANHSVAEIRDYLGVDSLEYLSVEGMLSAVKAQAPKFCTACFTGEYPVSVSSQVAKLDLEKPASEKEAPAAARGQ
jgi:amidophosphoribosyltransferase